MKMSTKYQNAFKPWYFSNSLQLLRHCIIMDINMEIQTQPVLNKHILDLSNRLRSTNETI